MTSSFDTFNREELLKILEVFLDEDEMRIMKTLIDKAIEFRSSQKMIITEIGSSQGDSMSPILFLLSSTVGCGE